MTTDQVNEVMEGADVKTLLRVIEPPTGKLWGEYIFRYGPHWQCSLVGKSGYIIEEKYRVYFDDDCRVRKALRLRGGIGRSSYVFDTEIKFPGVEHPRPETLAHQMRSDTGRERLQGRRDADGRICR